MNHGLLYSRGVHGWTQAGACCVPAMFVRRRPISLIGRYAPCTLPLYGLIAATSNGSEPLTPPSASNHFRLCNTWQGIRCVGDTCIIPLKRLWFKLPSPWHNSAGPNVPKTVYRNKCIMHGTLWQGLSFVDRVRRVLNIRPSIELCCLVVFDLSCNVLFRFGDLPSLPRPKWFSKTWNKYRYYVGPWHFWSPCIAWL